MSQSFCAQKLSVRTVFCAKKSKSKSFLAGRRAEMSWDELSQCSNEMKKSGLDDMWERMGRDEKSWDDVPWGEKRSDYLRWDQVLSVKCKCEAWSAGCEECSVKCEENVCLMLHCNVVARRSRSWTATAQQVRTKHARMAQGTCKFSRWKRTYSQIKGNSRPASCGCCWYAEVLFNIAL